MVPPTHTCTYKKSHQLTQEDKDAGQDGNESTPAQTDWEHIGLWAAGHDVAIIIAAAHLDGECAGTAEYWLSAVSYEDGQVEDTLLLLPEAGPPG